MAQHHAPKAANRPRAAGAILRALSQASVHRLAGRFDKAKRELRLVLDAEPNHPDAHYQLGAIASATGDPAQATPHFVTALRTAPDRPGYWLALANSLLAVDRIADARSILERFMAQDFGREEQGSVVSALTQQVFTKARLRYDEGALSEAEALLDLVIALDDGHAAATHLAGAIAAQTNRLDLAVDLLSIAIYRDPDNARYYAGLGSVYSARGEAESAISANLKAVELDPDLAVAHTNLAGIYQRCFRHGDALRHGDRAVALDPDLSGAHCNRGNSLLSLGRMPDAIDAFDRALSLDPDSLVNHSNRLFAKLYAGHVPATEYFSDARAFGLRFGETLRRRRAFSNARTSDRRLKIGFVSGDLFDHALARFIEPYLRNVDRARFETVAYMTYAREDATSDRLRPLFDGWRNIAGLDDDAAADLIESDAIDVLVDLAGHSACNRLLVFARKPAPVQVTWMGHPATTGLAAIDYRLTDLGHDPVGQGDDLHVEALWRLPHVSATYQPASDLPPVAERAACEENGHVTFGCFNRLSKISDDALATWARILAAVEDARLFMVVANIDAPDVRASVEARLAGAGLPLDRMVFHTRVDRGYYALYHRIDIALDPFPYNGGTTTCDTLCMGAPLVTLEGSHAAARSGVAVLTAVGLEALIAPDLDAYVTIACDLARDRDRLLAIRRGLRQRMMASPLMDHPGLARDVGEAFEAMWGRWLAQETAVSG